MRHRRTASGGALRRCQRVLVLAGICCGAMGMGACAPPGAFTYRDLSGSTDAHRLIGERYMLDASLRLYLDYDGILTTQRAEDQAALVTLGRGDPVRVIDSEAE